MSSHALCFARPLAQALPAVSVQEARQARLLFDARFSAWLPEVGSALLGPAAPAEPPTAFDGAVAGQTSLLLAMQCSSGELVLALPSLSWPAFALAAMEEDVELRLEMAHLLLAQKLPELGLLLPGLRVRGLGAAEGPIQGMSLVWGSYRVTVSSVCGDFAQWLGQELRQQRVSIPATLRQLKLGASMRLFERGISLRLLRSLTAGDLIVGPALQESSPVLHATLLFGTGITMNAPATLSLQDGHASLTHHPTLQPTTEANAAQDLGTITQLNVPVSFELDTARISLAELAALGTGSVVELVSKPMDASIRIMCFGQSIGTGQLVVVGDQLGVRVVRMGLTPAD